MLKKSLILGYFIYSGGIYVCIFSRMLCPILNNQLENKETVIVDSMNIWKKTKLQVRCLKPSVPFARMHLLELSRFKHYVVVVNVCKEG